VEDNELNREIATEILQMVGLEVETAENGSIGVDKVAAAEPGYYNLVLMDIQMPVMNGYEATCAIRTLNHKDAKSIPIVAMTANAFAEDIQTAKSSGMNEHMAKPIDLGRLMEVLERWLR
ncbi:MAG: response regulator, partial [Acetatifactor sp.]|nr:response regulator [Acetatifactor sp.]